VGNKVGDRVPRGGDNDLSQHRRRSASALAYHAQDYVASSEEIGRLPEDVGKHMNTAESGCVFRINNGSETGQEVFHLYATHLRSGTKMRTP
jgi:hypothetical protein